MTTRVKFIGGPCDGRVLERDVLGVAVRVPDFGRGPCEDAVYRIEMRDGEKVAVFDRYVPSGEVVRA